MMKLLLILLVLLSSWLLHSASVCNVCLRDPVCVSLCASVFEGYKCIFMSLHSARRSFPPCSYPTVPALDALGRRLLPFSIEIDVARFVYLDRNVTNDFAKFVNTFHYYFQQCMTTK